MAAVSETDARQAVTGVIPNDVGAAGDARIAVIEGSAGDVTAACPRQRRRHHAGGRLQC
jgi:hypothetical protein